MAGLLIGLLHWPQLLALFGLGSEPPRFLLEWKDPALPFGSIAAVLGAAVLLELLPYSEEFWRGLRASPCPGGEGSTASRRRAGGVG